MNLISPEAPAAVGWQSDLYPPECILLLVPTRMELDVLLRKPAMESLLARGMQAEVCGFGLVASGLLASRLISAHQPAAVVHAGIAGSLLADAPLGRAFEFGLLDCDGIGIGAGHDHVSAGQAGWQPFGSLGADDPGPVLSPGWPGTDAGAARLVSVCSASANAAERQNRRDRFPDAIAEDMESWSVAMAARLAGVPVRVFRGLSNLAGDRDLTRWKTAAALESVAALVSDALDQPAIR